MKPFRNLRPAEPSFSHLPSGADHAQSQKRHHHSKEEWDRQKELVFKYYVKEKLSLEKTMAKFAAAGFMAKERTWKKMIKIWGFEKNVPETAKKLMLEKKKERTIKGKDTTFLWGFNEVPRKRLEQFENGQIGDSMGTSMHQADTPAELHYYTPNNISTPIADCDMPTHEISVNLMTEQAKKVVEFVTVEQVSTSGERYTENCLLLEAKNHPHQLGLQRFSCSGRFKNTKNRRCYLMDARNLAIDLNEAIHRSSPFVCQKQVTASGDGPEYFLMNGDTSSITQEGSAFLEFVRNSKICPLLFGLDHISSQWKQNWRSLDMKPALDLNQLASRIFGDLRLPFPGMVMSCLLICFRTAPHLEDCKLIRITFGVDKNPEIQECRYCQPAFMALDYIDCNGAMKVHIPLTHAGNERRCMDEHEYSKLFQTEIGTVCSSLVQLAISYQGWSYLPTCYQKDSGLLFFEEEDAEEWDPHGSSEQDVPFQPYPPDRDVHFCSNPQTHIFAEKEEDEDF